jgi:Zn-dependent protease
MAHFSCLQHRCKEKPLLTIKPDVSTDQPVKLCLGCGTQLAHTLLACPACKRLVHAEALRDLAAQADAAMRDDRIADALHFWEQALDRLPLGSRQHAAVNDKVREIRIRLESGHGGKRTSNPSEKGKVTGLAAIGALLLALLSKGKLLLLGFGKLSTVMSMILSMGVYWTAYGWKFAVGLVLSIYVHEMGHVAALRRYGIKATAPMFIPGIGAIIRLKESPSNVIEDARVGLAGPLWGLATAAIVYAVYLVTRWPSWAAIGVVGAWINLFNLLPVWQLDGGRGFNSLTRAQRFVAAAVIAGMWWYTKEGLLLLILLASVARALGTGARRQDRAGLLTYILLLVTLSLLCRQYVPRGY